MWMEPSSISKIYILVHGAWHGSWCWHKIARHIENSGHKAITPDLLGHHGHHQNFKDISLADYVAHIEKIIGSIPQPVILAGHSMAGVAISQVAENIPHKISQLIYISGFVPQNGGSLADEEKKALIPSVGLEVAINQEKGYISLPSPARIRELFYAKCSDEDIHYSLSRLQKQPLRPFLDTISISETCYGRVPKLYIECLQDKAVNIEDQRRMHSGIRCNVLSLNTDHSPFFSADYQLTQLICGRKR